MAGWGCLKARGLRESSRLAEPHSFWRQDCLCIATKRQRKTNQRCRKENDRLRCDFSFGKRSLAGQGGSMKRSLSIVFCLFLAMSAAPSLLRAQDVASVTGVVTDTSDAVIVGAGVALVNTTTNASYHTKTNSLGSYIIVNVPPGPGYKLTFTQSGFRPEVVTDIYLAVASTRTQNAKLHAGDVSQTIEVSAANEEVTLDTTDATIGNNIDIKLLNDLPVQVRDTPAALFSLQPGVVA